MAVERVNKVLIAVHKSVQDQLVCDLQREGLLHVVSTESGDSPGLAELDRRLTRLMEAIEQLDAAKKKKGLFGAKLVLSRQEFERLARESKGEKRAELLAELNRRLSELDNRKKSTEVEQKRLWPWKKLRHSPADLYQLPNLTVILGLFSDQTELERVREELSSLPVAVEPVETGEFGVSAALVATRDCGPEVTAVLASARFESVDLRSVREIPARVLDRLDEERKRLDEESRKVEEQIAALQEDSVLMKVAADALLTEKARETAVSGFGKTRTVAVITGWVKERDRKRLEELVEKNGHAVSCSIEPDPGEEPPVALVNSRPFRPFELVLELFSLPSPREIDPTVLLAPFFALFFAFCLTDAGYGIAVAVLAWLLMRKLGRDNKLLGMIFISGIVTVVAGAAVGGWFGDLPDRLAIPVVVTLKNKLMLFDPLQNPMPFFVLSIGFGYLHLIFGILIEIIDCIRVRQYGDALLGQLPWFVVLNGLLARLALGGMLSDWLSVALLVVILVSVAAILVFTRRSTESIRAQWLWFALLASVLVFLTTKLGALPAAFMQTRWLVLLLLFVMVIYAAVDLLRHGRFKVLAVVSGIVGMIGLALALVGVMSVLVAGMLCLPFLFSAPANRGLVKKFLWGAYALYGATSYIGVVLSYIRIMALGMVTGGIAMAINTIAWMVLPIPVLGVLLGVIALSFGHAYNIAVNVLGAFVHTLRLNYVEFFPRFYTGGGEPFTPLRERYQYVSLLP